MRSNNRSQILLIGTGSEVESKLRAELRARPYDIITASRGDEGLAKAIKTGIDVVVSGINTRGLSGLELLNSLHPVKPNLPVILVGGAVSKETVLEAARLGVFRLLSKPFDFPELLEIIRRAVLRNQPVFQALEPREAEFGQTGLIGTSRLMRRLYHDIGVAAGSQISVLILGETGTGKELIARAIHRLSSRAKHPFVSVDCNAITPTLFESEVFGHERGAFTGAGGSRQGLFERANQGVLFLDEIGDLDVEMQVKLLRFLEERRLPRVGGRHEVAVDVKVVAATNGDLEEAMQQGRFRKELFYRLNGFSIKPPQLTEHPQDILDLVRHFLGKIQETDGCGPLSIRREAVEFLEGQPWPGNVRELKNTVHRAVLQAEGAPIGLSHVELAYEPPKQTAKGKRPAGGDTPTDLIEKAKRGEEKKVYEKAMELTERYLLVRTMSEAHDNQSRAARWLGIARGTLRERLRHFGIGST